jgi:hypothetical protein
MASGGDNDNGLREYDVALKLWVSGMDINAVVEEISNNAHCPDCFPSGVQFDLATSTLGHPGDTESLYIYYPLWTHVSSGFQLLDTWAQVPIGPQETAMMTVTDACARLTVLSADKQTESGVLYRY